MSLGTSEGGLSAARPGGAWDIAFVRRFMFVFGPVSSLFDVLTFWPLVRVFDAGEVGQLPMYVDGGDAGEAMFHAGWFVESMATQVLVIFLIRTHGYAFASRPHPWPLGLALAVVVGAACLAVVQGVKWWFYRSEDLRPAAPGVPGA